MNIVSKRKVSEIKFLQRNFELVRLLISLYYPFKFHELVKYHDCLNWGFDPDMYNIGSVTVPGISSNRFINWDTNQMLHFKNNLDFDKLISNPLIYWNVERINIIENNIKPQQLNIFRLVTENPIKWDYQFNSRINEIFDSENSFKFESFDFNKIPFYLLENELDDFYWNQLCVNPNFPWTIENIEKYKEHINWRHLSINKGISWNIFLIKKYSQYWDIDVLMRNKAIYWSKELVEGIIDIYSEDKVLFTPGGNVPFHKKTYSQFDEYVLTSNNCIKFSNRNNCHLDSLINWETFNTYLPKFLARKEITTSIAFNEDPPTIKKSSLPFKWNGLSCNCNLHWSEKFIEMYIDRWDWFELSANPSLPWSNEFINHFKNYWKWYQLSSNGNISWNNELLDLYQDKINFGTYSVEDEMLDIHLIRGIDINSNVSFDYDLIKKFESKWNWEYLIMNPSVRWSIKLFNAYRKQLLFIIKNDVNRPFGKILFDNLIYPIISKTGLESFFNLKT